MAIPAAREPGPLVTLARKRTVAKADSIGLGRRDHAAQRGARRQRWTRRLQSARQRPLGPGGHQRGSRVDGPEQQGRQDIRRRRRVGLLPAVRHLELTATTIDAGTH